LANADGTANFSAEGGFSINVPGTYQLMISFGVGGLVLTPLVTTSSFTLT
jgi:hypothetical protein